MLFLLVLMFFSVCLLLVKFDFLMGLLISFLKCLPESKCFLLLLSLLLFFVVVAVLLFLFLFLVCFVGASVVSCFVSSLLLGLVFCTCVCCLFDSIPL